MPKLCEGCGFYSADNDPARCPNCDAALKFTFLPPAGASAAPLAGAPTDPYRDLEREQRAARAGLFGIDWRIVQAVGAALVAVAFMGVRFYLRMEAREEREARQAAAGDHVRPGTHSSEAAPRNDFDPDDDEEEDAGDDAPRPARAGRPVDRPVAPPGGGR